MSIFENAKFGDAFKTRDGRKAIFLGLRDAERRALMLYNISTTDFYIGDKKDVDICTGMVYSSLKTTSDIISKWHEPINRESLTELSTNTCGLIVGMEGEITMSHVIQAYNAGYHKAEEKLL